MLRKIEIALELGVIVIILSNMFFPLTGTGGKLDAVGSLIIILGLIASQLALRQDKKQAGYGPVNWRLVTIILLVLAITLTLVARIVAFF
ncbi:hypothetical protein [Weissella halotolerans]|nr:hypothetical protein [Weissella halotolerans]